MDKPTQLPTWAPRIKPYLIRRLYENDAKGICDEELLEQVGWSLYSRCKSFIEACEASGGLTHCPTCGTVILHQRQARQMLHCPACGWECVLRAYLDTIRNQQLDGGPEVVALFQQYVDAFPRAQSPQEKMVLIDQLIHGFHHYLRSGRTRRPVGVNLIDGDLGFVIQFLDHLSYSADSSPGLQETGNEWRKKMHLG